MAREARRSRSSARRDRAWRIGAAGASRAPGLVPRRPRAHGARDPGRLRLVARAAGLRGAARLLGLRLPRGMGDAAGAPRDRGAVRLAGLHDARTRALRRPAGARPPMPRTSTRSPIRRWRWARPLGAAAWRAASRSTSPPTRRAAPTWPSPAAWWRGRWTRSSRYFGSAPFDHYTALVELLKPISPDHRYGFSMEHLESSHYFLAADAGRHAALPGAAAAARALQLRAPRRPRLDPEAGVRRGLLPLLVGARSAHRHDLAERGLRALRRDRGARRHDARGRGRRVSQGDARFAANDCWRRCRPFIREMPLVRAVADRLDPLLGGLPHRQDALRARRAARRRARRADPARRAAAASASATPRAT